jgi:hypothetical protein
MVEILRDEKIHSLETTIRFYAAQSRRWETRCRAIELELHACQERLAALGYSAYGALDGE